MLESYTTTPTDKHVQLSKVEDAILKGKYYGHALFYYGHALFYYGHAFSKILCCNSI